MTYDIALTQSDDGEIIIHRADCPRARLQADLGKPVATLFGCETLPFDLKHCACMDET